MARNRDLLRVEGLNVDKKLMEGYINILRCGKKLATFLRNNAGYAPWQREVYCTRFEKGLN